jgi:hypothetical protein
VKCSSTVMSKRQADPAYMGVPKGITEEHVTTSKPLLDIYDTSEFDPDLQRHGNIVTGLSRPPTYM